jgi:hypothetical protein
MVEGGQDAVVWGALQPGGVVAAVAHRWQVGAQQVFGQPAPKASLNVRAPQLAICVF